MGEQLHAQVLQRALADPADQVGLQVGGERVDDRRDEECGHDQVKRADVVAADAVIDGELGQRRGGQRGRRWPRPAR